MSMLIFITLKSNLFTTILYTVAEKSLCGSFNKCVQSNSARNSLKTDTEFNLNSALRSAFHVERSPYLTLSSSNWLVITNIIPSIISKKCDVYLNTQAFTDWLSRYLSEHVPESLSLLNSVSGICFKLRVSVITLSSNPEPALWSSEDLQWQKIKKTEKEDYEQR